MAGLGLQHLPAPKRGYRPIKDTRRPDDKVDFESKGFSKRQDQLRSHRLFQSLEDLPVREHGQAVDLAQRLREGVEGNSPPRTIASSLYMRHLRNRIIGNLWPIVEDAYDDVVVATLMPTGMWVPASELSDTSPRLLMKRLINDLDRTGVTCAPGTLFAGLHAEFDVRRGGYDFHYHLVATGEKAMALDNLRDMPKYKSERLELHEAGMKERPRVKVTRGPFTNMPEPITYVVQSWLPHRPTKILADGTVERSSFRWRIPEPYHARWLLWMDRHSISDFVIMQGMKVTKTGFYIFP